MKNTTVLVPIDGNLASLSLCIASLAAHLPADAKVILISDPRPGMEDQETVVHELISGKDNFKYHCSRTSLGFEGLCNHGVFEMDQTSNDILVFHSTCIATEGFLDELHMCLYENERHGIAFPRSNITFDGIFPLAGNPQTNFEKSLLQYLAVRANLVRHEVLPFVFGSCFLVRRHLIENFGFLSTENTGASASLDSFFMRLSQFGYSIVRCNRSFVYQSKDHSDQSRISLRNPEEFNNLLEFSERVKFYKYYQISPDDHFESLLNGSRPKKSILFSFCDFPGTFNGTTEYGFALMQNLQTHFLEKYEIALLVNNESYQLTKIKSLGFPVFTPETIEGHTFDLCFIPRQIFSLKHLFLVNRAAPRIVISFLDIISLRCLYLATHELKMLWTISLQFFQKIVCISQASKKDIVDFFSFLNLSPTKFEVIHLGLDMQPDLPQNEVQASEDVQQYSLIVGNSLKHKAITECLLSLTKISTKSRFVVLGGHPSNYESFKNDKQFEFVESGYLPDSLIDQLYRDSDCVIFPSQYEGFGFPVLKAVKFNKKIILYNSEVNRELSNLVSESKSYFFFFDSFSQIPTLVEGIKQDPMPLSSRMSYERSWADVARDTEDLIESEIVSKIDLNALRARFRYISDQYYFYSKGRAVRTPKSLPLRFIAWLDAHPSLRAPRIRNILKSLVPRRLQLVLRSELDLK